MEVLQRRGELMNQIENETFEKLKDVRNDKNKYKELMTRLIIQSLIRMDESEVVIRVVKEDQALAQSILKDAVARYKKLWRDQVGEEAKIKASLDTREFLPNSAIGGVEVSARQNKIILDNTLPSRLTVSRASLLPILRYDDFFGPCCCFFFFFCVCICFCLSCVRSRHFTFG